MPVLAKATIQFSRDIFIHEEISRLECRITALGADIILRQETGGDQFTISLGSQTLMGRGIAAEMLLRVGESAKGLTGEPRLGFFAGFDLTRSVGTIGGSESSEEGVP